MVDYVVQTMEKAIASAASRGGKPTTEDIIFLVRKVTFPKYLVAMKQYGKSSARVRMLHTLSLQL